MAWGIRLSPVLRHQSGVQFARQISVPASAATPFGLVLPATTYYAEDASARREDNIWVFDVRAEKTLQLPGRMRIRGFIDFFNITNSHASETITRTGSSSCGPRHPAPFTTRPVPAAAATVVAGSRLHAPAHSAYRLPW